MQKRQFDSVLSHPSFTPMGRTMGRSPTSRSKLDPPEPIIEPQPLFEHPSIWWKGPEEYRRADQHADRLQKALLPHVQNGTKLRRPPPGHVRVCFWWSLSDLKRPWARSAIRADIPLDPGGSLDLLKVQKLWGLESVTVLHPLRWRIFEPADPNRLSALAVQDLSIDRFIFVTEHPITGNTTIRRVLRLLCIDLYFLLAVVCLLFYRGYTDPAKRVPVPEWYDDTAEARDNFVQRFKGMQEIDETYQQKPDGGNWLIELILLPGSYYAWLRRGVIRSLNELKDNKREFFMQWGITLLVTLMFCFVWLLDRSIVPVIF